jgi:hypothetical protein
MSKLRSFAVLEVSVNLRSQIQSLKCGLSVPMFVCVCVCVYVCVCVLVHNLWETESDFCYVSLRCRRCVSRFAGHQPVPRCLGCVRQHGNLHGVPGPALGRLTLACLFCLVAYFSPYLPLWQGGCCAYLPSGRDAALTHLLAAVLITPFSRRGSADWPPCGTTEVPCRRERTVIIVLEELMSVTSADENVIWGKQDEEEVAGRWTPSLQVCLEIPKCQD